MPKEYFIPTNTEIIFVADLYSNEYVGGAELTTDAIIAATNKNIFKLHSESLTPELVEKNKEKYWILCNWSQSPIEGRIQLVQSGCQYSIIEYDYKYCKYRSSHLHKLTTKNDCDCHLDKHGKWVASFYKRAEHLFFMSSGQMNEYCRLQATEQYAKIHQLEYELIGGLPYEQFIQKLGEYEGLIFHPAGFDTCPRLVVEAKLMGLKLDLNENVQHKDEEWFNADNIDVTMTYLRDFYNRFWKIINKE